jgi:hypothetical protein
MTSNQSAGTQHPYAVGGTGEWYLNAANPAQPSSPSPGSGNKGGGKGGGGPTTTQPGLCPSAATKLLCSAA